MYLRITLALCKCSGPRFKTFATSLVIFIESEVGHGLIWDKLIGLVNLKMIFGGDGIIRMPCAGVDKIWLSGQRDNQGVQ